MQLGRPLTQFGSHLAGGAVAGFVLLDGSHVAAGAAAGQVFHNSISFSGCFQSVYKLFFATKTRSSQRESISLVFPGALGALVAVFYSCSSR
jgi:hypothetical protein